MCCFFTVSIGFARLRSIIICYQLDIKNEHLFAN